MFAGRNVLASDSRATWLRPVVALLAVLAMLQLVGGPAQAAGGLTLSTQYPGISVEPGERVTFPLEINNTGPAGKVDLTVVTAPEGWETSVEGSGKVVQQVFVGQYPGSVDLKVKVPVDAKEGKYRVVATARGAGSVSNLTLEMQVSTSKASAGEMVAQYPELQGPSEAAYKFRVDLTNNTPSGQSYSLGAQAPPGWQVTFSPAYDSKQIASLSLEGGKSQGLDVEITPPKQVKAGKYVVPVTAVSAASTVKTELRIIITGNYKVILTTPTGRLNAQTVAGKESGVSLEVKNNGSAELKNINLSSWEPSGWSVTFEPDQIDLIAPGESRQVTAKIKPDTKAIAGDYVVQLTAANQETSGDAEMRVMVKTSTLWGIVGLLIVLLVVAGVAATFRYYGRR